MVESFKPEYKGIAGEGEASGRDEDAQLGKIRTGRLRRDYDRSVLSSRRDAVGLVETNEGSSNSKRKRRRKKRTRRKNGGKREGRG